MVYDCISIACIGKQMIWTCFHQPQTPEKEMYWEENYSRLSWLYIFLKTGISQHPFKTCLKKATVYGKSNYKMNTRSWTLEEILRHLQACSVRASLISTHFVVNRCKYLRWNIFYVFTSWLLNNIYLGTMKTKSELGNALSGTHLNRLSLIWHMMYLHNVHKHTCI